MFASKFVPVGASTMRSSRTESPFFWRTWRIRQRSSYSKNWERLKIRATDLRLCQPSLPWSLRARAKTLISWRKVWILSKTWRLARNLCSHRARQVYNRPVWRVLGRRQWRYWSEMKVASRFKLRWRVAICGLVHALARSQALLMTFSILRWPSATL